MKLYILNSGDGQGLDKSRWTPGVDVGQPVDFAGHCYLIEHRGEWFLFDTGVDEAVADLPNRERVYHEWGPGTGPIWRKPVTLASQFEQLGIVPSDIKLIAISHSHPDHAGNIEMFPQAMMLVQKAEYEWKGRQDTLRFDPDHPVTKLEGDHDVFGDGSLVLIATPGHTPGHQSLLVRLPKTGAVILSGDVVHFMENLVNRSVPENNFSKEQSLASFDRVLALMATEHAQLWINHDSGQAKTHLKFPSYYE